eukprot:jgi/Botrbrau1/16386/Bobra.0231s0002.1
MNVEPIEQYGWKYLAAQDGDDDSVLRAKQHALLQILEVTKARLRLCQHAFFAVPRPSAKAPATGLGPQKRTYPVSRPLDNVAGDRVGPSFGASHALPAYSPAMRATHASGPGPHGEGGPQIPERFELGSGSNHRKRELVCAARKKPRVEITDAAAEGGDAPKDSRPSFPHASFPKQGASLNPADQQSCEGEPGSGQACRDSRKRLKAPLSELPSAGRRTSPLSALRQPAQEPPGFRTPCMPRLPAPGLGGPQGGVRRVSGVPWGTESNQVPLTGIPTEYPSCAPAGAAAAAKALPGNVGKPDPSRRWMQLELLRPGPAPKQAGPTPAGASHDTSCAPPLCRNPTTKDKAAVAHGTSHASHTARDSLNLHAATMDSSERLQAGSFAATSGALKSASVSQAATRSEVSPSQHYDQPETSPEHGRSTTGFEGACQHTRQEVVEGPYLKNREAHRTPLRQVAALSNTHAEGTRSGAGAEKSGAVRAAGVARHEAGAGHGMLQVQSKGAPLSPVWRSKRRLGGLAARERMGTAAAGTRPAEALAPGFARGTPVLRSLHVPRRRQAAAVPVINSVTDECSPGPLLLQPSSNTPLQGDESPGARERPFLQGNRGAHANPSRRNPSSSQAQPTELVPLRHAAQRLEDCDGAAQLEASRMRRGLSSGGPPVADADGRPVSSIIVHPNLPASAGIGAHEAAPHHCAAMEEHLLSLDAGTVHPPEDSDSVPRPSGGLLPMHSKGAIPCDNCSVDRVPETLLPLSQALLFGLPNMIAPQSAGQLTADPGHNRSGGGGGHDNGVASVPEANVGAAGVPNLDDSATQADGSGLPEEALCGRVCGENPAIGTCGAGTKLPNQAGPGSPSDPDATVPDTPLSLSAHHKRRRSPSDPLQSPKGDRLLAETNDAIKEEVHCRTFQMLQYDISLAGHDGAAGGTALGLPLEKGHDGEPMVDSQPQTKPLGTDSRRNAIPNPLIQESPLEMAECLPGLCIAKKGNTSWHHGARLQPEVHPSPSQGVLERGSTFPEVATCPEVVPPTPGDAGKASPVRDDSGFRGLPGRSVVTLEGPGFLGTRGTTTTQSPDRATCKIRHPCILNKAMAGCSTDASQQHGPEETGGHGQTACGLGLLEVPEIATNQPLYETGVGNEPQKDFTGTSTAGVELARENMLHVKTGCLSQDSNPGLPKGCWSRSWDFNACPPNLETGPAGGLPPVYICRNDTGQEAEGHVLIEECLPASTYEAGAAPMLYLAPCPASQHGGTPVPDLAKSSGDGSLPSGASGLLSSAQGEGGLPGRWQYNQPNPEGAPPDSDVLPDPEGRMGDPDQVPQVPESIPLLASGLLSSAHKQPHSPGCPQDEPPEYFSTPGKPAGMSACPPADPTQQQNPFCGLPHDYPSPSLRFPHEHAVPQPIGPPQMGSWVQAGPPGGLCGGRRDAVPGLPERLPEESLDATELVLPAPVTAVTVSEEGRYLAVVLAELGGDRASFSDRRTILVWQLAQPSGLPSHSHEQASTCREKAIHPVCLAEIHASLHMGLFGGFSAHESAAFRLIESSTGPVLAMASNVVPAGLTHHSKPAINVHHAVLGSSLQLEVPSPCCCLAADGEGSLLSAGVGPTVMCWSHASTFGRQGDHAGRALAQASSDGVVFPDVVCLSTAKRLLVGVSSQGHVAIWNLDRNELVRAYSPKGGFLPCPGLLPLPLGDGPAGFLLFGWKNRRGDEDLNTGANLFAWVSAIDESSWVEEKFPLVKGSIKAAAPAGVRRAVVVDTSGCLLLLQEERASLWRHLMGEDMTSVAAGSTWVACACRSRRVMLIKTPT